MSRELAVIQGAKIVEDDDGRVHFVADADIDGDGANGQFGGLPCYAPSSYGKPTLDDIRNGGKPGNWWGVVTNNGKSSGTPVKQGAKDPCPGAYVSATSLKLRGADGGPLKASDPFRYVDAATVPFAVVPPAILKKTKGIVLGCKCIVTNRKTGKTAVGVVADSGPTFKIGEISPAMARLVGVPASARSGGEKSFVIQYEIFPGVAAVVNGVEYPLQGFGS